MDRQYISERTGFDHGALFEGPEDVRNYFTTDVLAGCVPGRETDLPDEEELAAMAATVIENWWHLEAAGFALYPASRSAAMALGRTGSELRADLERGLGKSEAIRMLGYGEIVPVTERLYKALEEEPGTSATERDDGLWDLDE